MLDNGYTISQESDYTVLQSMIQLSGINMVLPEYNQVAKYPEFSLYSLRLVE
jgi:hypothetical protein